MIGSVEREGTGFSTGLDEIRLLTRLRCKIRETRLRHYREREQLNCYVELDGKQG